ncbi:hypothetical protein [Halorarius halobius]|uniref:hypothetical protein n=1 Tax=Halorarius halobius TaxID=2962671 RepID=UPI0020CDF9DE|nr:hypothetical protein [Halorarius halobius]
MDYRTLAAAVLGVALGALLVAYPEGVVRAQMAGRFPTDRRGEYGEDGDGPRWLTTAVRLAGVACIAAGGYFGWTLL